MKWVIYLQDTNGSCRVIGDGYGLIEEEADRRLKALLDGQNKPHKVEYFKASYSRETKQQVFAELGLNC